MKIILSLIIGGALVVSGFGQTRNVLVGTNNAVVQPTNFWSADAINARSGLGLGSAATNPASAFQPSSLNLSNIAANNGGGLTNLNATNIVGILGVAQGGTGSTNASDARTALGLGTAATNPATAFQSSSTTLSNLATGNGGALSNLQATNLVGLIPLSNIPSVTLTNLAGTLSIAQGGTGATNASDARANLGATTIGNTIFTATNAEDGRTALFLGTAATSAVTAFQPANANLTNLSTNNGALLTGIPITGVVNLQSNLNTKLATNGNGSGLTSITAANINGTVALASNITGTAALATNVTGVVSLANGGTGATNASSARTSLGATTIGSGLFTLLNPSAERFIRINADNTPSALAASDFRTAIGLGTAATNASTAFQPSSSSLTNLSANNGSGLSNIAIAGVTGLQTALDGKLSTTATAALATNVTGTVAIANGGTGATNVAGARTSLGATTVGSSLFTLVNPSAIRFLRLNADNTATALAASDFRTAIGLGTAATNAETAFQPASANLTNLAANNGSALTNLALSNVVGLQTSLNTKLNTNGDAINLTNFPALLLRTNGNGAGLTNITAANITGTVGLASNVSGVVAITNGGSGATTAGGARTNLGLTWAGLTNPSASTFQTALFGSNTNPVLVNTNGEVVSPTNFWQVAPITTTFIESEPTVSQTTNMPAGRNLHIHSIAPSTVGITNTIALPITNSFNGDIALVVHQGPTSSVTAVRMAGAATNLVTLNQFEQAVEFVFYNNEWQFNHNNSFIEPIYFSGTNAVANAAASRTNLGLGATNEVQFAHIDTTSFEIFGSNGVVFDLPIAAGATRTNLGLGATWLTNDNVTNFRTAIGLGATNNVRFNEIDVTSTFRVNDGSSTFVQIADDVADFSIPVNILNENGLDFGGTNAAVARGQTRTNLGLPLPALTNTSNVTFQSAVFTTNAAPTNAANVNSVGFNTAVRWMDVTLNIDGTNQVFRIPLFQ
jgi:hypothetical protein